MKRLAYTLLFSLAMYCGLAHASQIVLTLPESQLTWVVEQACLRGVPGVWDHCEKDDNGGHKTTQEKIVWMANRLLQRFKGLDNGLADIQMTIEVKDD